MHKQVILSLYVTGVLQSFAKPLKLHTYTQRIYTKTILVVAYILLKIVNNGLKMKQFVANSISLLIKYKQMKHTITTS